MTRAQDVRGLAAAGMGASAIARELGISRARVYKIAADNSIAMPRVLAPLRAPQPPQVPRPPVARVITGGIVQPINASTAGCIAELLAAADLMARGWQVFLPILHSKGHDIIAVRADAMVTIEVRSAYRNAGGTLIFQKQPDDKSDHYALVVTGEPVSYRPEIP